MSTERFLFNASVVVVVLGLVACGSTAASGSASSPTATARAPARVTVSGTLQQINGQQLTLSSLTGASVTVMLRKKTVIMQTSPATLTGIAVGGCLSATGHRDASGVLTALLVRLTDVVNGTCRGPGGTGGGGGVTGSVTAVSGGSVTVQPAAGAPVTLIVPATARISRTKILQPTALQVGQCLIANGTKEASGAVSARSITVVPPAAGGQCFSSGGTSAASPSAA